MNVPCNVYKSETGDEEKAVKNKEHVRKIGGETKTNNGTLIKFPLQYKPYMYFVQVNRLFFFSFNLMKV